MDEQESISFVLFIILKGYYLISPKNDKSLS